MEGLRGGLRCTGDSRKRSLLLSGGMQPMRSVDLGVETHLVAPLGEMASEASQRGLGNPFDAQGRFGAADDGRA